MKGGIRLDKEKETEFNSAYDLYADMLYKIAFLHTADKDESEDILQEVFIKLMYKSPTFKFWVTNLLMKENLMSEINF